MNQLIKPPKLCRGDTVAMVSVSNGWAGDKDIKRNFKTILKYLVLHMQEWQKLKFPIPT